TDEKDVHGAKGECGPGGGANGKKFRVPSSGCRVSLLGALFDLIVGQACNLMSGDWQDGEIWPGEVTMHDSSVKVPEELEGVARKLAQESGEAEPTILRIYWFPHSEQIRLVEIDEEALHDDEETIHPFYFRPMK